MNFTIDVAGHAVFLPALALAGLGVGFVAGMFGIGGGFILTHKPLTGASVSPMTTNLP